MRNPRSTEPAGYEALIADLGLTVMPPAVASFVRPQGVLQVEVHPERTTRYYPASYAPDPTPTAQLEFALKYDGVNLEVLRAAFAALPPKMLARWIRGKPTGKYTRRAWFLYEWLTGKTLDVPDVSGVAYVDALGSEDYFTTKGVPSARHRVRDDLLGGRSFCPIVRRTETLSAFAGKHLPARVRKLVAKHDPALLHRAAQFLYLKETRSSFEIEREQPDRLRTIRFVELLRHAHSLKDLSILALVDLQKAVLDPRFAKDGYRTDQNYVGEARSHYLELVHYVSPKPGDVEDLMDGLLQCNARLGASDVDPVVQAALLGFGFVFIHPFDDGNGRLHRYLIHHVLTRTDFTPEGLVLPVSAVMLADRRAYDACLETFSRPLLECIDYEIDARGALRVQGESAGFYRYFDATRMAEYLYAVVERTIDSDLAGELDFLARFDAAWKDLREIVDLPDRRLELFLRLCLGNRGKLAAGKRRLFRELTDGELVAMEKVVAAAAFRPGA